MGSSEVDTLVRDAHPVACIAMGGLSLPWLPVSLNPEEMRCA